MVQYFDAHYETWGTRAVTPPESTNTASVEHVLYIPTPEGSIIFFQQDVFVKPHMPQWGWGVLLGHLVNVTRWPKVITSKLLLTTVEIKQLLTDVHFRQLLVTSIKESHSLML